MAKSKKIVAEICLYGASRCGHGWLAMVQGQNRPMGDGQPVSGIGMTAAIWNACDALQKAGISGAAAVFAPSGTVMAKVDLAERKHAGDLHWEAAPVLVVSAADIEAAAVAV